MITNLFFGVMMLAVLVFLAQYVFRLSHSPAKSTFGFVQVVQIGLGILVTLYAIVAIEYFLNYNSKDIGMWERFLSKVTSDAFSFGDGSVREQMHDVYAVNRWALHIHATTGSIMLFLGFFQFFDRLRVKWPKIHRLSGQVYVALAIPTCVGSVTYLISASPDNVFSGHLFFVTLSGLAGATAFSTTMAFVTALQKKFDAHRAWMWLSYFCILSAPILRVVWITTHQFIGEWQLLENNLYSLAPSIAIVAVSPLFMLGATLRRGQKVSTPSSIGDHLNDILGWGARPLLLLNAFALIGFTVVSLSMLSGHVSWPFIVAGGVALLGMLTLGATAAFAANMSVGRETGIVVMSALALMIAGFSVGIETPMGATFPSTIWTIGFITLVATILRVVLRSQGRQWHHNAWGGVVVAMLLVPSTMAVLASLLWAIGWTPANSLMAGFLMSFFVNPGLVYWQVIRRGFR